MQRPLAITLAIFAVACSDETLVEAAPAEPAPPAAAVPSGKADGVGTDGTLDWDAVRARCTAPEEEEPILYSNAFSWGYTLDSMAELSGVIYDAPERLFGRAWYDAERDVFVMADTDAWGGEVLLPPRLIDSVRAHVEQALALKYVDHIFFPDMGHSHFFIPHARWDEVYAGRAVSELSAMRTALLDDPELRVLYHTAEQLEMLDEDKKVLPDRRVMWRFMTRNPVGGNHGTGRLDLLHNLEQSSNTARDMEGYFYYGAGFNLSANANGCFPYVHEGQVRYFDISMQDLPRDPSVPFEDEF